MDYRPRSMTDRFMEGAPAIVRKNVLDIIKIIPAAPLDYDVIFRQDDMPDDAKSYGLDFDKYGARGCHFYLMNHEMRAYRERNRRNRVAWRNLPESAQSAIIAYLEEWT